MQESDCLLFLPHSGLRSSRFYRQRSGCKCLGFYRGKSPFTVGSPFHAFALQGKHAQFLCVCAIINSSFSWLSVCKLLTLLTKMFSQSYGPRNTSHNTRVDSSCPFYRGLALEAAHGICPLGAAHGTCPRVEWHSNRVLKLSTKQVGQQCREASSWLRLALFVDHLSALQSSTFVSALTLFAKK